MPNHIKQQLPVIVGGTVIEGKKRGRTLGFPTANIVPHGNARVPLTEGVYAGWATVASRRYAAMVSFGRAETFNEHAVRLEAHLLGYNNNLYGREIDLEILAYIRPIKKFASAEELIKALRQDREKTLELLKE